MPGKDEVIKLVHHALEYEPRVNLHRYPVRIGYADGAVVLEGEVGDVATKKLALDLAAAVDGVRGVVDRLRVAPSERRGDGAIRDALTAFLQREPEFRQCSIRIRTKGRVETLREVATDSAGEIEIAVADGVISLEGRVISHSHKRLAGVLAWWTPGCRDVVNSLYVEPAEEDNDGEVVDALRLALEMDAGSGGADPRELPQFRSDARGLRAHRGGAAAGRVRCVVPVRGGQGGQPDRSPQVGAGPRSGRV